MRAVVSLSLFGVGVVVALILLSLGSLLGYVAAMVWGFGALPHGAVYLSRHSQGGGSGSPGSSAADSNGWRNANWR